MCFIKLLYACLFCILLWESPSCALSSSSPHFFLLLHSSILFPFICSLLFTQSFLLSSFFTQWSSLLPFPSIKFLGFWYEFSKQRSPNVPRITPIQDYPRALRGSGEAALQSHEPPCWKWRSTFFYRRFKIWREEDFWNSQLIDPYGWNKNRAVKNFYVFK